MTFFLRLDNDFNMLPYDNLKAFTIVTRLESNCRFAKLLLIIIYMFPLSMVLCRKFSICLSKKSQNIKKIHETKKKC